MSCIKPNTHVHCLRFPDFNNWLLRFIDGRVNSCFWNILALILCFQILALNSGFQTLALNSGFQTLALNSGFKTLALILCSSKYFYISACWEERIPPRTKVACVSLNTITQFLSSATAFLSLVFVFHSTFTSSAVLLPVLVPWLSSNTNR